MKILWPGNRGEGGEAFISCNVQRLAGSERLHLL